MPRPRLSFKFSAANCLPFLSTLVLLAAAFNVSPAQTLTALYTFKGPPNDGANAAAGLIADALGNLYGTTQDGGPHNFGTVFELTPAGVESTLYFFPNLTSQLNLRNGIYPSSTLIFDAQGNLYGTTNGGGKHTVSCFAPCGTVFKITPRGRGKLAYAFVGSPDGQNPLGGLIIDTQGNLYGTTTLGGVTNAGAVFKLTSSGVETVLHSFIGSDGVNPAGNLAMDASGNLYGTTQQGGAHGYGVVFELTPDGTEATLYNFAGTDGAYPNGLIFDAQDNLYGTTSAGGTFGSGTVFKLTPQGVETVLYNFAGYPTDGASPTAGLVMDEQGNLFGTTAVGGVWACENNFGCGTVFKIAADGTETVLHNFCSNQGCTDGQNPAGGLVLDAQGNLYGSTFYGGQQTCDPPRGCGVVFKLAP